MILVLVYNLFIFFHKLAYTKQHGAIVTCNKNKKQLWLNFFLIAVFLHSLYCCKCVMEIFFSYYIRVQKRFLHIIGMEKLTKISIYKRVSQDYYYTWSDNPFLSPKWERIASLPLLWCIKDGFVCIIPLS